MFTVLEGFCNILFNLNNLVVVNFLLTRKACPFIHMCNKVIKQTTVNL